MNRPPAQAPRLHRQFLERMHALGELIPGAAEALTKQATDYREADRAIGDLLAYFRGEGKGYLSNAGSLALKREPTTKFVLNRLPLRPGAADQLYQKWAADFAASPPEEAARWVVHRIERPACEEYLAGGRAPGAFSPFERKARALLHLFDRFFANEVDLDELARKWGDLGSVSLDEGRRRLVARLKHPDTAAQYAAGGVPPVIFGGDEIMEPIRGSDSVVVDELLADLGKQRREELAHLRREVAKAEAERDELRAKTAELEARQRARLAGQTS